MDIVPSPLLSWLTALICLIASTCAESPGLKEQNGRWVAPGGDVQVVWEATAFTAAADVDGSLELSHQLTRGQFAIVTAETSRDCVQRAALEIGTMAGVTFFDLSLADRPATDPAAIAGMFQFSQGGVQQIAYVECRELHSSSGGRFLEIRIVSPEEAWPESLDRWSAVLTGIEIG